MEDQNPVFAYIAIGGMGKSALTWYWLQEDIISKSLEPDGIVWWSFYDKESSFDTFADKALKYICGGEVDPKNMELREKLQALYNQLYETRFLVVLDGLERILRAYAGLGSPYQGDAVTEDEKQDFRACIDPNAAWFLQAICAGHPRSKILITSRLFPKELDGIAGCRRFELTKMDKEHAVEFFRCQGVDKGTRAEIEKVCEFYGYHPLSLRLLSGMIAKDRENPGDISKWLEYNPLSKLTGKSGKGEHNILEIAYEALDDEDKELISSLAAFRAPMEYKAIEALVETGQKKKGPKRGIFKRLFGRKKKQEKPIRSLKERLSALENRGLLFFDKVHKRFDLHPIVRSYCYDRLGDKEGVHSRLINYFESVPQPGRFDSVKTLDDLSPVIELYHHTLRAGRYDEACDLFYERLASPLHYQFGAYQLRIELLEALFPEGYDKTKLSDESALAWTLNELANSYSASGQPRNAVKVFEMIKQMDVATLKKQEVRFVFTEEKFVIPKDHKMNSTDLQNAAISLGNLASAAQIHIADFEYVESNLRRRIEIAKEINDERNEAIARQVLGRTLVYYGEFGKSDDEIKKAIAIFEKQESYNSLSISWSCRSLRALLMDDPEEALKCAQKVLEFAEKDAAKTFYKPRDFNRARLYIGASYVAMGKPEKSEQPLNFAITECRKINLVELEPAILLQLAKLEFLRDNKDETGESLKLATEALEIAERCGYLLHQADIEEFLCEYYIAKGKKDTAREWIEKCIEHSKYCWRYCEDDKPDFPYVKNRSEPPFYYAKKPEQWHYKPRLQKATHLQEQLP